MASPSPLTYIDRAPVVHPVGPGLHFADAPNLADHFVRRRPPPQVQGHQSAGHFGHPVLKAAGLAQASEDLEGLAVFVQAHGDEQATQLGGQFGGYAGQAAGPASGLRSWRSPFAGEEGQRRSVAVEVARYIEGQLPLPFVAQAQQRPGDGFLAVLFGEGRVEEGVPHHVGQFLPPLPAQLQPAVAGGGYPPDAFGQLLDVLGTSPRGCAWWFQSCRFLLVSCKVR